MECENECKFKKEHIKDIDYKIKNINGYESVNFIVKESKTNNILIIFEGIKDSFIEI